MNQSIISWWRDSQGGTRGVTALILTTFLWAQVYPAAAAAKDAMESKDSPAPLIKSNAAGPKIASPDDPQRATMEGLAKTLSGMNVALKKHRDVLIKRKDKKGNLHITILGTKADVDLTGARKEISQFKQQMAVQDLETEASFKSDAEHIKAHNLPALIQQRHDDAVAKYEKNRDEFQKGLNTLEQSQDLNTLLTQSDALLKEANGNLPKHAKFDPKNLPFRTADPKVREPATTPQALRKILASNQSQLKLPTLDVAQRKQDVSDTEIAAIEKASKEGDTYIIPKDPVQVASIGSMSGLLMASIVQPPGPEYLAPTEDVQITPAIQAKAAALHNNPVEIYNWVHNNIEYMPTHGSIQGSEMALQSQKANAFDTSSLLIALLRASGIPARYVYGTVEIPIDKAMNWVGGVANSNAALQLLGQGGVPSTGLAQGGKVYAVRMEHVWVEAFVDAYPSRGAKNYAPEAWLPMDASYKQYSYTQGMNISHTVPPDIQNLQTQVQTNPQFSGTADWIKNADEPTIKNALQSYQQNLHNYINNINPTATVGDVLGNKSIIVLSPGNLVASLPYRLTTIGSRMSELSASLRHKIQFSFYASSDDQAANSPSFTVERSLPSLAGHRVSFVYEPETADDKQVLDQAFENYQTSFPAYEVHMRPSLKVEGDVIQSGPASTTGTDQILSVSVETPWYTQAKDYLLTSGDYMAVIIDPAGITSNNLDARTQAHDLAGGVDTQFTEEMFYQIGLGYWLEETAYSNISGDLNHVVTSRLPSHGLAGAPISVVYSYGTPRSATYKSRILDVKEIRMILEDKNDNHDATIAFAHLRGTIASFLESAIYDQSFLQSAGQSLSAATALQLANEKSLPIYKVTSSNAGSILSQLQVDNHVKSDIMNATSNGYEVTVPQSNMTVGTFTGTGYIIFDPSTGSGQYLISGGRNGNNSASGAAAYPLPQIPATSIFGLMVGQTVRSASAGITVNNGVLDSFVFSGASVGAGEATGSGGIATAGPLGAVLAALIVCLSIESAYNAEIEARYPPTLRVFRHYTTSTAAPLIDFSKTIIAGRDGGDYGLGVYTEEPPDQNINCPMSRSDVFNVMQRYNIKGDDRDSYVEFAITRSGYWDRVLKKIINDKGAEESIFLLLFIYYGPYAIAIEPYGTPCY